MLLKGKTAIFNQVWIIVILLFFFNQMLSARGSKKVESLALSGLAPQSDDTACFNFSVGSPHRKEFYSPNYPAHYPKNTRCTLRITAEVGHMVMLDFRDQFRLENSATCEYDRLEVRDGAYGYSPLIGQFCGAEFPSKMYSSKRYMWLQFTSDDSIEYEGFRAVYDYVPIPNPGPNGHDTECAYYRSGPSGIIEKTEIDALYQKYRQEDTIECMWTIETEPGKQLYINFIKYRLERPNDCDQNFIQIFSDGRTPDKLLAKFCGTTAEPQKSPSNVTHVRLFTHRDAFNGTDFVLHYTSFREIRKEEQCDSKTEFNCGDQTCIDIALKCDGQFDCKYRYDEEPSSCMRALGAGMVLTSEHMIIILVVFFSLVVAMCASISISCYNKIRERQLREREYKERRSKEASVEATVERQLRERQQTDAVAVLTRGDDESSDGGGCYVPEMDMSVFGKQHQRPNGGETIPKKPRGLGLQQQQYPYISESFESLESDVIVPPAPPPVPMHMKDPQRDMSPPAPTYRIVGGKVVANPAKNEPNFLQDRLSTSRTSTLDSKGRDQSRPGSAKPGSTKPDLSSYLSYKAEMPVKDINDAKSHWLRGPLEAGAPRSAFTRGPGEIGLPKFGMSSRVTPDHGARGPLAASKNLPFGGYRPGQVANRMYPGSRGYQDTDLQRPTTASDSSRAQSVASTLSAPPDALAKR